MLAQGHERPDAPDQAPLVIATVRAVITDVRPTAGYAERAVAMALIAGPSSL